MDYDRIVYAIIGFSASFFLCLPNLKRWHRQQVTKDKLRIVSLALEQAEERLVRFQERHDRILSIICSFYLSSQDLEDALVGARTAMNEALDFSASLRRIQMKIIDSYPDDVD